MIDAVHTTMEAAWAAYTQYRLLPLQARRDFLHAIAAQIEALGDELLHTTDAETNLPDARLRGERARTCHQLRAYGDACLRGDWLDARIDTADPERVPPKPDIRKTMHPIGPVVVFGASNFPFAYSTAGGDTASAFAAGCSVVVKAHPAHPKTSALVAGAIQKAIAKQGLPAGLFGHLHAEGNALGEMLVRHPRTKAVGFTGSFHGGMALYRIAQQRPDPIPVFAEMGSVNPVYLLPQQLKAQAQHFATQYAMSITLGVGQFCTNPGILVGIDGPELDDFAEALSQAMRPVAPAPMLHLGIAKSYQHLRGQALQQPGVSLLASADIPPAEGQGNASLATVSADDFLANPKLHEEVFGPYSILVRCRDIAQMQAVAIALHGQLTSSLIATESELLSHPELVTAVREGCGRIVFNGVPTGVEVVLAQHHGGPFPASTDSRFTAVGADAIRRFARPIAFQGCPDALLPPELQNGNPLGIRRTVNDVPTTHPLA